MSELAARECVPCRGGVPALAGPRLAGLHRQLRGWEIVDGHHLKKRFRFANFREALGFVNRLGELAEEQGHHPDVGFGWGWAEITVFTHSVDGLTENDFILAAKVDEL